MAKQLAFISILSILAGSAAASGFYPPSLNQKGSIALTSSYKNPTLTVSMIEDKTTRCPWEGDCLLLVVKLGNAKYTEIKKKILSSYGAFQIFLVDVNGDGMEEIVLITGGGRGTSVRAEALTVYQIAEGGLKELLTAPYSAYFGSGKRWWYEPLFERRGGPRDSEQMTLTLRHDEWEKDEQLVSPELIPSTKVIHYQWNTNKKLLEPKP